MSRLRRAAVFLQLLQLPERNDRCHGLAGALNDKLITLVVDLLKHLAEILTGFQRIECFNGGTKLVIHRITLVDITDITISTITNPLSTSSRGGNQPKPRCANLVTTTP